MIGVDPVTASPDPEGSVPAENVLIRSLARWQQGDWEALSQSGGSLEDTAHRGSLAALVAAAFQQLGDLEETNAWSKTALHWGCDKTFLGNLLVAGVHNNLGKCAALQGATERMLEHFQAATRCALIPENPHATKTRAIRELTKLGLLSEAARLVDQKLKLLPDGGGGGSILENHVNILRTELSMLQSELALAQKRGQLQGKSQENGDTRVPTTLEDAEKQWLDDLRARATSQLGHEIWVLEKTSYKRGGFFVEFGATNGILLSNTFLLEKGFGWRGLCAEPNPVFFEELRKNRLCTLSTACIGATTGEEVEFIFADVFGGMARDAACDQHEQRREDHRNVGNTAVLTTISLHDFLKAHGAPKIIDYISIDTEGSEFSILETFPFDEWDVRMLTIEHNYTEQREKIRTLLEAQGYLCQEAQWDDWFYKPDRQ